MNFQQQILSFFDSFLIKGHYVNDFENKKKHRVGMAYGSDLKVDYEFNLEQKVKLEKQGVKLYGSVVPEKIEYFNKHFKGFNLLQLVKEEKDIFNELNTIDPQFKDKVGKLTREIIFSDQDGITITTKSKHKKNSEEAKKYGVEIKRVLRFQDGKRTIEKGITKFGTEIRGYGLAKRVLKNVLEQCYNGKVEENRIDAAFSEETPINGCNTWAFFDYRCTQDEATKILAKLKTNIGQKRHAGFNEDKSKLYSSLSKKSYDICERIHKLFILDNDKEGKLFPLIQFTQAIKKEEFIAGMQDIDWKGVLVLSDKEQMQNYKTKLGI